MEFINVHGHSLHSHDCASKLNKIVDFVKNNNQSAIAITDHGGMSGVIKFQELCLKAKIKPLIGVELYVCTNQKSSLDKSPANRRLNHLVVLAKNKIGYNNLLKLVSISNRPENYYYKNRLDEETLFKYSEGLIVINGHYDSSIHDCLIFNLEAAATCSSVEEAKEYLFPDYKEKVLEIANRYKNIWGDDFYIECQLFDQDDVIQQLTGFILFNWAKEFGFKAVGSSDFHYIEPKDSKAHKTFVAIKQNCKISSLPDIGYFNSGKYGIVTNELAESCYPEELILATQEIANKIEIYDITRPQKIPTFTPSKEESLSLVKNYSYDRLKIINLYDNKEYLDRTNFELSMIEKGEIPDYFLIVKDYLDWARSKDILTGVGRGSVGSSLVAYLLRITAIDSIKYDLMWDRFMGPDRIENKVLPDIDSDFQTSRRHEVVEYIRNKYGADKVCGVVTFGILQGKSAIKGVFSAWDIMDVKQQKDITDRILPKDKISDKLADFKEETGSDSIILYMLTHEPDALKDYVALVDGKIEGEFAPFFELAIELEGAIRNESRHASAYIISDEPLDTLVPLIKDKNDEYLLCAYDMYSFERAGVVKFDLLSLKSLDGLFEINKLLKNVDINTLV